MTHDELPRRPRPRLVTPATAALTAVLIAALGFIGGVQVQKSQGDSGGGAGGAGGVGGARTGAGFARAGGFSPGGGSSDATVGTVANVAGKSFYVTGSGGTTVRVKTTSHSKVTRTAVSTVGAVHPGDTVVVQGTKSSSGAVTATSVTATAKNASSGLAGLFGGGGAGNAPAGG
jgi:hypothetical protein